MMRSVTMLSLLPVRISALMYASSSGSGVMPISFSRFSSSSSSSAAKKVFYHDKDKGDACMQIAHLLVGFQQLLQFICNKTLFLPWQGQRGMHVFKLPISFSCFHSSFSSFAADTPCEHYKHQQRAKGWVCACMHVAIQL